MVGGASLDPHMDRLIGRDFVRRRPDAPIYLQEFDSGSLPDPAIWRTALIFVTDKGCAAVSDGAAWVRPDGSAL